jgi:hypothetical protein
MRRSEQLVSERRAATAIRGEVGVISHLITSLAPRECCVSMGGE